MGLKYFPDIAQGAMENVLSGIKDADVYIDDVGAFSDNWDHHLNLIATILLWRLHEIGSLPLTHLSENGPSRKLTG